MAILILGQSTCGICGKVIKTQEESCSFPSFISTKQSRYRKFGGNNFHVNCVRSDADAAEAVKLLNAFRAGMAPATRVCAIDGQPIQPGEDFFFIEYVTDDQRSFLRRNVYKNFKVANLSQLDELLVLHRELKALSQGEEHLRGYAKRLLETIRPAVEEKQKQNPGSSGFMAWLRRLFGR